MEKIVALQDALRDVRKSYRLLHQYQRRILDLSRELATEIDQTLEFFHWGPSHYNPPPRYWHNPADRWAWDYLPLYDFCTFYARKEFMSDEHAPGSWMLAFRFRADTGFIMQPTEPDPLRFDDPAEASSVLHLYAYQYTKSASENWIHQAFNGNDWPSEEGPTELAENLRALSFTIPLNELADAESVHRFARNVRERIEAWLGEVTVQLESSVSP